MWTRKSILLTGLGATMLVLAGVAKSWQAAGVGVAVLSFVATNFFLYRREANIQAKREMELARVFENDTFGVTVDLSNAGTRAAFMEVRDKLPREVRITQGTHYAYVALRKGESTRLRYELNCPLLGVYPVGPLTLRLEDPFGLFYVEKAAGPEDSLSVLPRKEDMRKAALLSKLPLPLLGEHQVNQPGDGFDFFALREYVPGDTMKTINWKASARAGKLMVNQMERVTNAEDTVIFDGRAITDVGPEDQSPRVIGARSTASIVNWLFGKKDMVRLVYYDDSVHKIEPAPSERQYPLILETLAGHKAKGDVHLKIVVQDILAGLKPRTPVILVSPLLDDPTIVEAMSVLLANEMIGICITPRPASLPGLDPEFADVLMADRERTIKALQGYGVFVVDLAPDGQLGVILEKGAVVAR